jgi:heme-degrading monooxygenase HmoA
MSVHVLVLRPRFNRPVSDEEVQQFAREAVPLYEQSGGFHALYNLRVSDREVVGISFWDSAEDAERGFEAARPHMAALARGVLTGPPERTSGDVLFAYQVGEGKTPG